jgi:hypothetical protein
MNEAEEAFELIDASDDADFDGPKPELLLARAERTLGIAFPPTYQAFLSRYGCGDIGGQEFYGVIKDDFENSSIPDAVWLTLNERKTGTPHSLVLVASTGSGGYYAIDLNQKNANGESPIIEWRSGLPNAEGNLQLVASDFGTFLLQQVRTVI